MTVEELAKLVQAYFDAEAQHRQPPCRSHGQWRQTVVKRRIRWLDARAALENALKEVSPQSNTDS